MESLTLRQKKLVQPDFQIGTENVCCMKTIHYLGVEITPWT